MADKISNINSFKNQYLWVCSPVIVSVAKKSSEVRSIGSTGSTHLFKYSALDTEKK